MLSRLEQEKHTVSINWTGDLVEEDWKKGRFRGSLTAYSILKLNPLSGMGGSSINTYFAVTRFPRYTFHERMLMYPELRGFCLMMAWCAFLWPGILSGGVLEATGNGLTRIESPDTLSLIFAGAAQEYGTALLAYRHRL